MRNWNVSAMPEPRLTERQIQDRISFHETGERHYEAHGCTEMARWSHDQAFLWRLKLGTLDANIQPGAANGPRDGKMLATGET